MPDERAAPGPAPAVDGAHPGLDDMEPEFTIEGPRPGAWARTREALPMGEALRVFALALVMFLAFRAVGHTYVVSGASMEPTFHDAEMVVVNRLAYRGFDLSWLPGVDIDDWRPFGAPKRGDVVVFEFPDNPERDFIKRVIGVPGDLIEVRDERVYVNGAALEEPYVLDPPRGGYPASLVPDGHVFVLGDNRNNSSDSRSWGMLPQSSIIGRADVRYWPLTEVGLVGHVDAEEVEVPPSR